MISTIQKLHDICNLSEKYVYFFLILKFLFFASFTDPRRKKRQAPKNTCPLLLVADYKFFENVGQKRLSVTTNYLVCISQYLNLLVTFIPLGMIYESHFDKELAKVLPVSNWKIPYINIL